MEKFDKNSTYTVIDITNALLGITDRYQDFESARCTVMQKINQLGIQSINGQKRNRYFTGLDAQRVLNDLAGFKQLSFFPAEPEVKPVRSLRSVKKFITLNTKTLGILKVRPEDICLITLPSLRYFLTFRGYGSLITLRNGRTLHVREEPHEVSRIIREFSEDIKNDAY